MDNSQRASQLRSTGLSLRNNKPKLGIIFTVEGGSRRGMKMRRIKFPGFFLSEGSRIKGGKEDEEDKTSRIFSSEGSRRIKTKIITLRIFSGENLMPPVHL